MRKNKLSGKVIYPKFGQEMCSCCGRRPATKLCDMPVRRHSYLGHPPRKIGKYGNFPDYKISMQWTATCDRQICDKCATSVGGDIDFCPDCMERIRNTPIRYEK